MEGWQAGSVVLGCSWHKNTGHVDEQGTFGIRDSEMEFAWTDLGIRGSHMLPY